MKTYSITSVPSSGLMIQHISSPRSRPYLLHRERKYVSHDEQARLPILEPGSISPRRQLHLHHLLDTASYFTVSPV